MSGPAPHPLNAWLAGAATTMAPLAPFALIEAMALGALVPLGLLLPLIATRGLAGLGYASAYGVIGAVVGLGHGLALAIVATVVIRASKRFG